METPSAAPPSVVSMLICDQVIDDKITNKKSAIGLFNMILVPRVPTTIPNLSVLASVTEISGRRDLQLRLIREHDNAVIFETHGPIAAPDPLTTVDLVFGIQGLRLDRDGPHAFELCYEGEILSRRRFRVRLPPPGAQTGNQSGGAPS